MSGSPPSKRQCTLAVHTQTQSGFAEKLSQYRASHYLGAGAFGTVYKGVDTKTGKKVAIKVIGLGRGDEREKKKLFKELDMMRQVSKKCARHHVVCLLDHFLDDAKTSLIIVMPYIPGRTLEQLYFEAKVFPAKATIQSIAEQLFDALAFIHSVDVCHHDLSEANVMWGQNRLTLIDFGWATRLHKKQKGTGKPRKKYCDDVNAGAKLILDLAQNHPDLHDYMQTVYQDSQSFSARQVLHHIRISPTGP